MAPALFISMHALANCYAAPLLVDSDSIVAISHQATQPASLQPWAWSRVQRAIGATHHAKCTMLTTMSARATAKTCARAAHLRLPCEKHTTNREDQHVKEASHPAKQPSAQPAAAAALSAPASTARPIIQILTTFRACSRHNPSTSRARARTSTMIVDHLLRRRTSGHPNGWSPDLLPST